LLWVLEPLEHDNRHWNDDPEEPSPCPRWSVFRHVPAGANRHRKRLLAPCEAHVLPLTSPVEGERAQGRLEPHGGLILPWSAAPSATSWWSPSFHVLLENHIPHFSDSVVFFYLLLNFLLIAEFFLLVTEILISNLLNRVKSVE